MAVKMSRKHHEEFSSIIIGGISVITGVFIYFITIGYDEKYLLSAAIGACVSIFFIIFGEFLEIKKAGSSQTNNIIDQVSKVLDTISNIKLDISRIDGLHVYKSDMDGLDCAISAAKNAIIVKNTVLRFGENSTSHNCSHDLYASWISTKNETLRRTKPCVWREIVSIHIDDEYPQTIFMDDSKDDRLNYKARYIDDATNLMIQLCICKRNSQISD
jgi:hypothetical protein